MNVTDTIVWPYASGEPLANGIIRDRAEDFCVDEELAFSLDGQGEHVYLHIEKRNTNTTWLAQAVARCAGVKIRDVGYAGLKDKRAITRQWFSVYLPAGKEPNWHALQTENIKLLSSTRHKAKLRRGAIRANHFSLTVRDFNVAPSLVDERIKIITQQGVPNYFMEQRFGHNNANIQQAYELFSKQLKIKDRQKRGLLFSAARSWLFNQLLALRVQNQNWNKVLPGDVMMLAGSKRYFTTTNENLDELQRRIEDGDIHPSGVLWGKGKLETSLGAQKLESKVINEHTTLAKGLERAGVKQARRSLRTIPKNMRYAYDKSTLELKLHFSLESGSYATAILRELANYTVSAVEI